MPYTLLSAAVVGLWLLWYIVKRLRRESIAQLLGPPPASWLVGHIPAFQRPEDAAGEADFEWTEKYGLALRTKGCFGEDILYLADPKALQYVLNTRAYNFPKSYESRARSQRSTGNGIVWAEGPPHSRQRKIMNPGFSHSALKGFLALFLDIGKKTSNACKAKIIPRGRDSAVVNVSPWLARTTLDVIGQAAFGYKFNSIDDEETELYKSYHNLFSDINYMISNFTIIFRRFLGYVPPWLSELLSHLPKKDLRRQTRQKQLSRRVAKDLIDKEMEAYSSGKEGGRDIMSILIKANAAEDPKRQLSEDEIISQISTLLIAGHETTANTVGWTLYELSRSPDVQRKLRDEIRAVRAQALSRGEQDITIPDLDSMKFMGSIIKETLRYHPIVPYLFRRVAHEEVIPLATPQRTVSGDVVTAIPVSPGQVIQASIIGYHRLKRVWGEDADRWRPERFLKGELPEQKVTLGVFGNLATFGSGIRGCIGWRFAVIEMQALLVELIDNFEFSPAPGDPEIKPGATAIIQPMVRGQESKGTQLPLTVTVSKKNGN